MDLFLSILKELGQQDADNQVHEQRYKQQQLQRELEQLKSGTLASIGDNIGVPQQKEIQSMRQAAPAQPAIQAAVSPVMSSEHRRLIDTAAGRKSNALDDVDEALTQYDMYKGR